MKTTPDNASKTPDLSGLSTAEMMAVISNLKEQLAAKDDILQRQLKERDETIERRDNYIALLEELLRYKKIQQFAASSEKQPNQITLFDEAELEVGIDELRDELPEDVEEADAPPRSRKRRQRGFSDQLLRERIELTLSDEEKAGASKTFFTKVKEELEYIPAQLKVLEYWQEKGKRL